jgi:hypothetical protein
MEIFEMDPATHRVTTSPQMWTHFVAAAAMTVPAVALYYERPNPRRFDGMSALIKRQMRDMYLIAYKNVTRISRKPPEASGTNWK